MSIRVFIIDSDTKRASVLKKILCDVFPNEVEEIPYSHPAKELEKSIAAHCSGSKKIPWLLAHDRNVQGVPVENYFSMILTYSGSPLPNQKERVLRLELGGEYGGDVWREYLNSKSNSLDIFYKPQLPETLAAAYLLMIAREKKIREKKIGVSLDSLTIEQWKEACDQYKKIGGDKNADWSDASGWDENKIGVVKKEIDTLFSPAALKT